MIRNSATEILNLIRKNDGYDKEKIINPDMEVQKITDIILSECRCSIIDKNGNYSRFGSSTDIRIIKMLIQIFLSNMHEIPPEVVSIALTKEGVIGPFKKISLQKQFDEKTEKYDIDMKEVFPKEFHVSIFKNNLEVREKFLTEILKPYVKKIILNNEILMSKSPVSAYINKYIVRFFAPIKSDEQLTNRLIEILKTQLTSTSDELIKNIADYIFTNIMNNKYFKEELISRTLGTTELQKLGKISIGFHSLVDSMAYETLQMIELRNFPYGELISIKDTFYTMVAVLESLCVNFENQDEDDILKNIEKINKAYNVTNKTKTETDVKYRLSEITTNKYGNPDTFVKPENIKNALQNLCKMIKVLLNKKDEIDDQTYIKEVLRIHYRFIKIQPFENGNGRTARALVNVLLQSKGMIGIFRKEKRKEYIEYIEEANKVIKQNEERYLSALSEKTMECVELENEFLSLNNLPFILANG